MACTQSCVGPAHRDESHTHTGIRTLPYLALLGTGVREMRPALLTPAGSLAVSEQQIQPPRPLLMGFGALNPYTGLSKPGRPHVTPAQDTPGLLGLVAKGPTVTVLLLAAINTVWGGGKANS